MDATERTSSRNRASELVHLERYEEAEAILAALLAAFPYDLNAHYLLAELRHIRGEADFASALREAAARHEAPPKIRVAYADTLRKGGEVALAERLLRDVVDHHGGRPDATNALAILLQECGRPAEAVDFARACFEALPTHANAAENLVSALLSADRAREALPIVERFRAQNPNDVRWVAYRADIARHQGEGLFEAWCDVDRLVRLYDVAPPPGYASIEALHAELRPALEARHDRHKAHPLDQSLRDGTQTLLGLPSETDPVVRAFLGALEVPIATYQADVGYDEAHPLRARNTAPARIVACWSVRLRRGGHHVNHIHPGGWMSSVYYVSVPAEADDTTARSGWLTFGAPAFPTPAGKIARMVKPRPGLLVLFPSYLWHGTTPIQGDEARLTVAFDAIPHTASG